MEETVLFSGPLNFIQVVLPLGSYVVYAEIFDEAGAFATFIIKKNMNTHQISLISSFQRNPLKNKRYKTASFV